LTTEPRLQGGAAPGAGTLEPLMTLEPFVANGSNCSRARGGEAETRRLPALRLPLGMRRDPPGISVLAREIGTKPLAPGEAEKASPRARSGDMLRASCREHNYFT